LFAVVVVVVVVVCFRRSFVRFRRPSVRFTTTQQQSSFVTLPE